jgi:hypothetical protein
MSKTITTNSKILLFYSPLASETVDDLHVALQHHGSYLGRLNRKQVMINWARSQNNGSRLTITKRRDRENFRNYVRHFASKIGFKSPPPALHLHKIRLSGRAEFLEV